MTNLTCFWHPRKGYFDYELETPCPECGREMSYPLDNLPRWGGGQQFDVVEGIDRGYYSATYVAKDTRLGNDVCLKIVPKSIYELHEKSFEDECRAHNQVAKGTNHLVAIRNLFDADVVFGDASDAMPCHIAVLDYVKGTSLKTFLHGTEPVAAITTAQIAIDLMRLLGELEKRSMFHNDLHAGNILLQEVAADDARQGAADPYIRAIAVDLGSMRDGSRSAESTVIADSHQVVRHLLDLARRLTPDPADASDTDFRLAVVLHDIANMLRPDNVNQRQPNWADLEAQIMNAFTVATSPWKRPLEGLGRFADAFNAQTMRAWFVPRLLVDPDGEWQKRLESPGPLVVTGMRGCGKTMLLRSLQFHARASSVAGDTTDAQEAAAKLATDTYVGLYVSCNRLLDGLGTPDELHQPYTRLFLSYAREALQALRHLEELVGRGNLNPASPRPVVEIVRSLIAGTGLRGDESPVTVERRIHQMLLSLENRESIHVLNAHPTVAMPRLAEAIVACSPLWNDRRVLFLLDDVSTRQLNEKAIRELVSTLMFASETCAFKLTTEAQTLELVLKSPGLVERAQVGRDYDAFDLAAQIHEKLRDRNGRAGREFVSEVLRKRAKHLRDHPLATPDEVLGDRPLISTARQIVTSSGTSAERKSVYWGMSALASICVGDIGDVISIYELILAKGGAALQSFPIQPKHQTSAFQEFCARRLYHLNRRGGWLKKMADGFAEAAHDLLMDSGTHDPEPDGNPRLRDYAAVYVRVTTGDVDQQLLRLRELMDAGVFVLTGGPDSPRTKTRDGDPGAQFILTYRKLLGLTKFIGLSQRDRFELSGEDLATWLEDPAQCATILKRNQNTAVVHDDPLEAPDHATRHVLGEDPDGVHQPLAADGLVETNDGGAEVALDGAVYQDALFLSAPTDSHTSDAVASPLRAISMPTLTTLTEADLADLAISTVITALGFEERTHASLKRLLAVTDPNDVHLVEYDLGNDWSNRIAELASSSSARVTTGRGDALERNIPGAARGDDDRIAVVDVTGLSKPLIFWAVRNLLIRDRVVLVAHTGAALYYPLDADVERRLAAAPAEDDYARLESCADILTGEQHEYRFRRLLPDDVDQGRRKAVLASSSAKHERLYRLLDERESDHVEILVPPPGAARAELARLAGRVAAKDAHSCHLSEIGANDTAAAIDVISSLYESLALRGNFAFEVGLTGSKSHAVALAAASTQLKFHQAWYVEPLSFDHERFTRGVGETVYSRISLDD